jgi:zinc protease
MPVVHRIRLHAMRRTRRRMYFAFVLLVVPVGSAAQAPLSSALPADPDVVAGTLDNGLTYYVRANQRPEHRAELRLVVNAGSILEEDDQRGLAHVVEHMAFNGTEHFQKQEMVDYLESIGMEFGPSVNASTSFDETIYQLRVPTDDVEILQVAFQILEDWAHGISFDPEEIDQERDVVIEEWRLRRGAGARISDQQIPVLFRGSRYAERLPIGTVETLESFSRDELIRFYETWYRPDLMAVVAVGDFEPEAIVQLVRNHLGGIPAREDPLERPTFDVPRTAPTRFSLATDPEATSSQITLLTLLEPRRTRTLGDYRDALVEGLATGMLNDRLGELARRADPPFLAAGVGRGDLVRSTGAYQLGALVPEDGHVRGIEAVLTEAERAARHGFTPTELERAKLDLLRARERVYADRDNQPSSRFANEYVNHFLTGEPYPGVSFEYEAARALVPEISLEEVNEVSRRNLGSSNRVVLASGIEKPGVILPSEEELTALFESVTTAEIEPWEDRTLDQPLVAVLPEPGRIVEEDRIEAVDVTVWRLSNGATVWLKPTDFREDEVVLRASSPGGWSRSRPDEHISAMFADVVARDGGVGDFPRIDLEKALAGKAVRVSPSIGQNSEGLSGSASPRDLETLFQLSWLYFTRPRRDEVTFEVMLGQLRSQLENRDVSPITAFADTLSAILTGHHPRARPLTVEALGGLDQDRALAFYRDRFASVEDFVFVLVGALDPEVIRPLVERYLGALPAVEREDGWVDLDIDPPDGVVQKVVRRGIEPQSRTAMVFTGPFEYTHENRLRIRVLASVLESRLRENLREVLGATYSVSASAGYEDVPEPRYSMQISFGSDPGRAEELRAEVFEEIERLKADGPTEEEVGTALEQERRSLETSMESNGWWASQLTYHAEAGTDPGLIVDRSREAAVTVASLREDARRYLPDDRYVVVVLLPEGDGND